MLSTILLLGLVYVSLFWAIVLHLYPSDKNAPRRFLGKIMVVASIIYISGFVYNNKLYGIYIWLVCFNNLATLAIYPMYYIYTRLLTEDARFSLKKHYPHFIAPVAIFLAMAVGLLIMTSGDREAYISEIVYGFKQTEGTLGFMYKLFVVEKVIYMVQMFVYVFLTARQINKYQFMLNQWYSTTENLSLDWVRVSNITFFFSSLLSAVAIIVGREAFVDQPAKIAFPAIAFTAFLFIIGALGNRQRPVKAIEFDRLEASGTGNDKIPGNLKEHLVALFEEEHIYLDKDLSIFDITEKLGTNRTYISRIINNDFKLNFATFVNNYRVEHAKRIILDGKFSHLEEVAELSGFGSLNSLYRAFTAKEKISIAQFRESLKGVPTNQAARYPQ